MLEKKFQEDEKVEITVDKGKKVFNKKSEHGKINGGNKKNGVSKKGKSLKGASKKSAQNQEEGSLDECEEIYISKRKLYSDNFGSIVKKGVEFLKKTRKFKPIKNFKKSHFFKPGQQEYHLERRIEYCEDDQNYRFQ